MESHSIQSKLLILLVLGSLQCGSEAPADPQRSEFDAWLQTADESPYAAVYHQPFSGRLTFGPSAPPPLSDLPSAALEQGTLRLTLDDAGGTRTVPRNRSVALGEWRLRVSGSRRSSFVTVFKPEFEADPPGWYPVDSGFVMDGVLEDPEESHIRPMLGLDGVRVEATFAGTLVGELAGQVVRLIVYRMPEAGSEEEELSIFFRDETNGNGTYTAGRFLMLRPAGGDRYRADFNRARNPFCAYNAIYPCPLPWRGNQIDALVEVGEKYNGGGLEISR